MHIEAFEFDLAEREITDARIGSDVYSGATVDWGGCMKADIHWIFEQLEAIVDAWQEGDSEDEDEDEDGESGWLLTGQVDPDDDEIVTYTLHRDQYGWEKQTAWDELTEDAQTRVLNAVLAILDAVHGLLLIYE